MARASSSSAFCATMCDGDTGGEFSSVKYVGFCSGGGLLNLLSSIVDVTVEAIPEGNVPPAYFWKLAKKN